MTPKINDTWKIVAAGPASVHELRAFHYQNKSNVKSQIFRGSDYSSVKEMKAAFEKRAQELNEQGYNIYTTLNPIRSDFKGKSAGDSDIDYRDLLLIDLDRTGDTKQPATDEDIQNSQALADEVVKFLKKLKWPEPIKVMSGNGSHLYYILDGIPNNEESKVLIKKTLKALANKFNNSDVSIDITVSNAGRITKVPGTIMRKGEESEGRPYRVAKIL